MAIIHVRIDDRLIHGQVATMWINAVGVDRIMVVDDAAAKDDVMKMSLKLACPNAIALSVLPVERAAERILAGKYENQRVFLIVKGVDTIKRLVDLHVVLKTVNVGNLRFEGDRVKIAKTIAVNAAECKQIMELHQQGVEFTAQLTPVDNVVDLIHLFHE